ncbi:hypothetical protein EAF04_009543 [Stromatinia cepivora]|nr:hypothetical protein EAF04_009543 [Stromatinia cepivora]
MCFPCWPFTDVYLEEEKKKKKRKRKKRKDDKGVMVFDPNTRQWVRITGAPQHQPVMPQPAFQPYPYNPYLQFAGHSQHVPFGAGYVPQPAMNSYGATGSEIQLQQMQTPDANKKQDMKPSDDDPFRMYWVREVDNTWTQRNRLTIDSGDIGEVRWYVTDGVFYAVRLPS